MSRTSNSIRNMTVSIAGQMLTVIFQFITRTVFINALGTQYLGITGLFTNIISMLSLTELGVGTAIIYKLYKPIEQNDEHRIYLLMKFYKAVYKIIGIAILVIGLIILPFLKSIIKDDISFVNIYFIFLLYLLQSVASYLFFAYKSALIHANQKEFITTGIGYVFVLISNILQIIALSIFKNFTLYVTISIFTTVAMNMVISIICDRMYPFINKKSNDTIDKSEIKQIFKDCYALLIYKANAVVLNATDNMVLSTFVGLSIVGIYSNYLMIFTFINTILTKIFSAITAGLGNLHASGDKEHEYEVFKNINFISFVLFTVSSLGVAFASNQLIKVWLGEEFLLSHFTVLLLGYKMYLDGQKKVLSTYRSTMGLFQQAKYRPLFGAIINIVASVILVNVMGISGVILGTIIADLLTYMWFDPFVIYKNAFTGSVKEYYVKRIIYMIILIICTLVTALLIKYIAVTGIAGVLVNSLLCVIVPVLIICIIFHNTSEFKYALNIVKRFSGKFIKAAGNKKNV